MTEIIIFDPLNRFLWAVSITIVMLVGITYLIRTKQFEKSDEKRVLIAFSCGYFGFGVQRIFFYFADFYLLGYYLGNSFIADYDIFSMNYEILRFCGDLVLLIGYFFMFSNFTFIRKRIRYIILFFSITSIILVLINRTLLELSNSIVITIMILSIFYLFRISSRDFQITSLFILLGYILLAIGAVLDSPSLRDAEIMPNSILPVIIIIGAILGLVPAFFDPDKLKAPNPILNWIIILIIGMSTTMIYLIVIASTQLSFFESIGYYMAIIIGLLLSVLSIFKIYSTNKGLKSIAQLPQQTGITKDVSKVFRKLNRVTEEEISISKEKKTCIVCKNEISRQSYICPECKAFYCLKCSNTLAGMENACWVCETPFDESKPVKLPEKVGSEIEIDTNMLKKLKNQEE